MSDRNDLWSNMEKDLNEWLSKFAKDRGLTYRGPNQSIVGIPSNCFRSDGMITDGKSILAVEIECSQPHPDTNVGKYWFLYDKYKKYEKIVLIHVYTPLFKSWGWCKELADFYIEKIRERGVPIEHIEFDFRNKKINYRNALDSIKSRIEKISAELFG